MVVIKSKSSVLIRVLFITSMLSILINVIQYLDIQSDKGNIVGAYCTGDGKNENDEYITFMPEGEYYHYQQGTLISQGKYELQYKRLYNLVATDKNLSAVQVVCDDDAIYEFRKSADVKVYARISGGPMLINIEVND